MEEDNSYPIKYAFGHPINIHFVRGLFCRKTVIMSDLHGDAHECIDFLCARDILDGALVICCGDMAGDGSRGDDADAVPLYKRILEKCDKLYFVQGNHDLCVPEQETLVNNDGTPCCVDGKTVSLDIGTIGGANGIVSRNTVHRNHKFCEQDYCAKLRSVASVDILLTHDKPKFSDIKPKYHIYGHVHSRKYHYARNGTIYINADARIIVNTAETF